jgi:tetratricopeptide (TPR) repeat protein
LYEYDLKAAQRYTDMAEGFKASGNAALARKDRNAAIKMYDKAITQLNTAIETIKLPDDANTEKRRKLMAICWGNKSAAWAMDGDGCDPSQALSDAKRAEELDPDYGKAYVYLEFHDLLIQLSYLRRYYRQSKAYTLKGDNTSAEKVLARGLRRPAVADALILLQTGGKGLPQTEAEIKRWMKETLGTNGPRKTMMSEVKGTWAKRVEEHMRAVTGK